MQPPLACVVAAAVLLLVPRGEAAAAAVAAAGPRGKSGPTRNPPPLEPINELVLTGTCSHEPEDILEGLTFRYQGRTKSGAPWYQSLEFDQYLYFDPDCSGGGDGEGWIIDNNAPDVNADRDLDGDGDCQYRARTRWGGSRGPPMRSMWFMLCEDVWKYQPLTLTENPEVHEDPPTPGPEGCCPPQGGSKGGGKGRNERTTTTEEPTPAPKPTRAPRTTPAPAPPPPPPPKTKQATTTEEPEPPAPSPGKGKKVTTTPEPEPEEEEPPADSKKGKKKTTPEPEPEPEEEEPAKKSGKKTTTPEPAPSPAPRPKPAPKPSPKEDPLPPPPQKSPKKLVLGGVDEGCEYKAKLNGALFELQGRTRSGAPYYKAADSDEFLYHVTTCDEETGERTPSVWVLDSEEPAKWKKGKKKQARTRCDYNIAHLEEAILAGPPAVATWKMWCDEKKVLELTITLWEVPEATDLSHHNATLLIVSGAHRLQALLAALVAPLAVLLARW